MSARGFGSVVMSGGVLTAALGCYLVSLKVASERAKLEAVETAIVLAERDIRVLETEIGTRGRLAQLERWNVNFIRLSAPSADQLLEGGFQLATLVRPPEKNVVDAPVVLAAAPAPEPDDSLVDDAGTPIAVAPAKSARPEDMMHVAGYKMPARVARTARPAAPPSDKVPSSASSASNASPKPSASTKAARVAAADPLAPLPKAKPSAKGATAADAATKATRKPKDTGSRQ